MISGFPYKVHEVDSSRSITVHNERRNHEKKKFVLQDALIIRESLEQPDLQGLNPKFGSSTVWQELHGDHPFEIM
ncbi:hypothetical protein [Peribacillus frigoritolerans]|uniref:hypothetical protein n=1 Tax=Peribacillus frigoritolerans TaxID=450367 RepID=UPI003398CAA3